jgi:nucleotide-binding universal stress UspA family protein
MLRMLAGSVAEAVARNLQIPTLLLPLKGRGFVDAQTGSVDLARLLVLGGSESDAQLGIDAAAWLVRVAGRNSAELMLLHVDDGTHAPSPRAPEGMQLRAERRLGALDQVAAAVTEDWQPGLLVMVSHGHDELPDVLWSSHTERVLHAAARPLLWVPAVWKPGLQRAQADS